MKTVMPIRRALNLVLLSVVWAFPAHAQTQTNSWPLLLEARNPHKTLAVQWLLRAWGERVPVTGTWDAATKTAAARFMQARHVESEFVKLYRNHPDISFESLPSGGWDALCSIKVTVGAKNDAVTALQTLLRARGYNVPTDGVFAPSMKPIIKQVQANAGWSAFMDGAFGGHYEGPLNGVAVTGDVDANTWAELFAPSRWKDGSCGVNSASVELLLRAQGYVPKSRTPAQKNAQLVRFQRAHGLIADGAMRDATWNTLIMPLDAHSRGDAVRAWQSWHNSYAGAKNKVRVTGRFDAKSRTFLGRDGRITARDWWQEADSASMSEAGSMGS